MNKMHGHTTMWTSVIRILDSRPAVAEEDVREGKKDRGPHERRFIRDAVDAVVKIGRCGVRAVPRGSPAAAPFALSSQLPRRKETCKTNKHRLYKFKQAP